jgi:hypothetical protein
MARRIRRSEIRAARRMDRISIAAPRDFSLARSDVATADESRAAMLLPYCLDFSRRRAIYVGGVQPRDAQQAPFYYLYLRRTASSVFSVPWESGPLHARETRTPVFLFSPGRCGSTLLGHILFESGIGNVSEPDFYTQATSQFFASAFNPLRSSMRRTLLNMGHDLCAALSASGPVVAKLRAESCRAPGLLIAPAEKRTIFMKRGFESWARSTGRAFRNGPRKMVGKYLTALGCYENLRQCSDCLLLHYEDLIADPSGTGRKLGQFLSATISSDAVTAAMKKDSQEGTPLAQGARGDTPGGEARLEKTLALWNSDKVKRLRSRFDAAD